MDIKWECQNCAHSLLVDEKYAGKQTACQNCGVELTIPVPPEKPYIVKTPKRKKVVKVKTVDEVLRMEPYKKVLCAIAFFSWATCDQIAEHIRLGYSRTAHILSKLEDYKMVMNKRIHPNAKAYWYLIEAGRKLIERCQPELKPYGAAKRNEIPDVEYNHHLAVVDRLIELGNRGFTCTSPRYSLWPKRLDEIRIESQYRATPDFWLIGLPGRVTLPSWYKKQYPEAEDVKDFSIGVEVEYTTKARESFARQLYHRDNIFWRRDKDIFWLWIPASKSAETSLDNAYDEIYETGIYTATIKTKNGQETIGLKEPSGHGVIFGDINMSRIRLRTPYWEEIAFTPENLLTSLNSEYQYLVTDFGKYWGDIEKKLKAAYGY